MGKEVQREGMEWTASIGVKQSAAHKGTARHTNGPIWNLLQLFQYNIKLFLSESNFLSLFLTVRAMWTCCCAEPINNHDVVSPGSSFSQGEVSVFV